MSLKMAHKVILPPKKNYIPQFLKQRDINSYCLLGGVEGAGGSALNYCLVTGTSHTNILSFRIQICQTEHLIQI
jgi:hypothetical protein